MIASPFYGPGELIAESCGTYQRSAYGLPNCFGPAMMWTVVYAAGAGMLYLAVLASFNRCLGRMAENRFVVSPRGGARRFRRSKSSTALSRLPEHVLPPLVVESRPRTNNKSDSRST